MGKWIEIEVGAAPDGYPISRYRHESCKKEGKFLVESAYSYCPYCGEKMTNVRVLKNGLQKYLIDRLERQGFVCE